MHVWLFHLGEKLDMPVSSGGTEALGSQGSALPPRRACLSIPMTRTYRREYPLEIESRLDELFCFQYERLRPLS